MSVYVGIDVHRKRSQVAVIDQSGEVLANRNMPNGVEPILGVIGGLSPGTPAAFEAAFGWGWPASMRVRRSSAASWWRRARGAPAGQLVTLFRPSAEPGRRRGAPSTAGQGCGR
jgi:hypothetical protein